MPILKTYFYILDYVKDSCLFLFFLHRMDFIHDQCIILRGLIVFHGATIVTSSIIMGLSIQLSNDIIRLDRIKSFFCASFLRLLFFICTPLMPIAIIFQAVSLSVKKKRMVSNWIQETGNTSVSRIWRSFNLLEISKRKVMVAYSDLKSIEASTEAVPQLFILSTFTVASILFPEKSGLGLLKNDSWYEYTFLGLSLLSTYATIIFSILTSMKIRKKNHLGLTSRILLGLTFSLQLIARLLLLVPVAILALPSLTEIDTKQHIELSPSFSSFSSIFSFSSYSSISSSLSPSSADLVTVKIPQFVKELQPPAYKEEQSVSTSGALYQDGTCVAYAEYESALSVTEASLILCVPILLHWISLTAIYQFTVPVFRLLSRKDKMLHILANTWVTIPVRELKHQVQVHKGQEQMKSLLLVMANLIITAAVTGHQIKEKKPWFPSTSQKFNLTWKQESTSCGEVVGGSEFLVFFALPSFVLHLMGCCLLLTYYKLNHPWRHLGKEREGHCCGKLGDQGIPIQCERPFWEEEGQGEHSHVMGVFQLQTTVTNALNIQSSSEKSENPTTPADTTRSSPAQPNLSSANSSYTQTSWTEDEEMCRLQKLIIHNFD